MKAMTLTRFGLGHLESVETEYPSPANRGAGEVLACGVCRTDLHVVDGDLPSPTIAVLPGRGLLAGSRQSVAR